MVVQYLISDFETDMDDPNIERMHLEEMEETIHLEEVSTIVVREAPKKGPRIPLDHACKVCGAPASAYLHYGAIVCYSCRAFFRRAIRKQFICRVGDYSCIMEGTRSNRCRGCRYQKCLQVGMKPEMVDAMLKRNPDSGKRRRKAETHVGKVNTQPVFSRPNYPNMGVSRGGVRGSSLNTIQQQQFLEAIEDDPTATTTTTVVVAQQPPSTNIQQQPAAVIGAGGDGGQIIAVPNDDTDEDDDTQKFFVFNKSTQSFEPITIINVNDPNSAAADSSSPNQSPQTNIGGSGSTLVTPSSAVSLSGELGSAIIGGDSGDETIISTPSWVNPSLTTDMVVSSDGGMSLIESYEDGSLMLTTTGQGLGGGGTSSEDEQEEKAMDEALIILRDPIDIVDNRSLQEVNSHITPGTPPHFSTKFTASSTARLLAGGGTATATIPAEWIENIVTDHEEVVQTCSTGVGGAGGTLRTITIASGGNGGVGGVSEEEQLVVCNIADTEVIQEEVIDTD
eukprot:TRINITY_DN5683_c0_g1_i8.p1 TRINITY_DN5683_c0_g1~~TRINITY_DN5683_c0_g1_i8.p1  ORF type:complete len:507 (-),score=104.61 TRINITY_DN5683_c0_g1_i8:366-1886(-)